jgi:hypothetical protein
MPGLPHNIGGNAVDIANSIGRIMGVEGGRVPSFGAYVDETAEFMPDRMSPIFQQILQQQGGELKQQQRTSRGRALMEMGLAMMGAQTPNFLSALGAGGAAGLGAQDRIRAERRGLEQGLNQTRMAQAQGLNARDMQVLGVSGQRRGQDVQAMTSAIGSGIGLATTGAQITEGQMDRSSQEAIAAARIAFDREVLEYNRSRAPIEDAAAQRQFAGELYQRAYSEFFEMALGSPDPLASPEQQAAAVEAARTFARTEAEGVVRRAGITGGPPPSSPPSSSGARQPGQSLYGFEPIDRSQFQTPFVPRTSGTQSPPTYRYDSSGNRSGG